MLFVFREIKMCCYNLNVELRLRSNSHTKNNNLIEIKIKHRKRLLYSCSVYFENLIAWNKYLCLTELHSSRVMCLVLSKNNFKKSYGQIITRCLQ